MDVQTFTSIFGESIGFKGPLTSCQEELREEQPVPSYCATNFRKLLIIDHNFGLCVLWVVLMRQIDIMVNTKKAEWENQLHLAQIQVDKRSKELAFLKGQMEQQSLETGRLQQRLTDSEIAQRDIVTEYEDQLIHLRDQVDNLKHEHDKLEKRSSKQAAQVEKERDQLLTEMRSKDSAMQRKEEKLEEYRLKVRELEHTRRTLEDRLQATETQKRSLVDKADRMEQQGLGYQSQLNKRRQMIESITQEHEKEIEELETQITRAKEESASKEETIQQLRAIIEKATGSSRERSSENAKLQEELVIAQSAIQQLEEERSQLQLEIQARDDLIQAAEADQRQHAFDISKFEQTITMKDDIIRKMENSDRRTESMELRRLREELRTNRLQIQSQADTETFHKDEIERLNKEIGSISKENAKLQAELRRKNEEVRMIEETDVRRLATENTKLKEKICSLEENHAAELEGMKEQISTQTSDLHRRDGSVADMSERAQRMEKELRETNERYDRRSAELQVTNAQLQALRLENRHLRDATVNSQLSDLSELYKGNMDVIVQLEDENRVLRTEVDSLREELTNQEVERSDKYKSALRKNQEIISGIKENEFRRHSDIQTEAERKIAALEGRLESNIRKYETQLHSLRTENELLRSSMYTGGSRASVSNSLPSDVPVLPEYVPRRRVDVSQGTSAGSEYTDTDALTYADLAGPAIASDSEKTATPLDSRRASITADFIADENRRESQLDRILDGRIADLKSNTDFILKKYT